MDFIEDYKKPLTFIVVVLLGRVLVLKVHTAQHITGFQQVIMSCFLPALLLKSVVALPVSELATSWQYPLVALVYSAFLMACMQLVLWVTRSVKLREERATLLMMFPGLAPGLTSMPYVTVSVAEMEPKTIGGGQVGIADLGIKFFVLFVLFIVAMRMSGHSEERHSRSASRRTKQIVSGSYSKALRNLVYSFLTEPVNFASMLGIVLLSAGPVTMDDASIFGHAIKILGKCCAPAIFLLIGMKVKVLQKQQAVLFMLMVFRTGLGFLFAALLGRTLYREPNEIMFWVFLCNSSLSFWPYTHICKIGSQEDMNTQNLCLGLLGQAVAENDILSEEIRNYLGQVKDSLEAGNSTIESTVEETCLFVTSILTQKENTKNGSMSTTSHEADLSKTDSTDRLNDLMMDMEHLLERKTTFSPTLALMSLSVSTSWTVFSCTILALTPVDFWVEGNTLLIVGGALVFLGMLGLGLTGWNLHMKEKALQAEATEEEVSTDLPSDILNRLSTKRRQTIVDERASITMLEAFEADFVLKEEEAEALPVQAARFVNRVSFVLQEKGGDLPSRASRVMGRVSNVLTGLDNVTACRGRNSVADFALRKNMERMDLDEMDEEDFSSASIRASVRASLHQSAQRCSRLSAGHTAQSMNDRKALKGAASKEDPAISTTSSSFMGSTASAPLTEAGSGNPGILGYPVMEGDTTAGMPTVMKAAQRARMSAQPISSPGTTEKIGETAV